MSGIRDCLWLCLMVFVYDCLLVQENVWEGAHATDCGTATLSLSEQRSVEGVPTHGCCFNRSTLVVAPRAARRAMRQLPERSPPRPTRPRSAKRQSASLALRCVSLPLRLHLTCIANVCTRATTKCIQCKVFRSASLKGEDLGQVVADRRRPVSATRAS